MTRIFTEDGASVPVTVLDVSNNRVTQIKTAATDGYNAVQVAYGSAPQQPRQQGAGRTLSPKRVWKRASVLQEFRVPADAARPVPSGRCSLLWRCSRRVRRWMCTGVTQGKGFAGTIKRHHFKSQRATHGNSRSHNVPGSIGMAQDPGRVFPGKRMAGHLGDVQPHRAESRNRACRCGASAVAGEGRRSGFQGWRCHRASGSERGCLMDLKVINDQGRQAPACRFRRNCSAANTTRRWCIRW